MDARIKSEIITLHNGDPDNPWYTHITLIRSFACKCRGTMRIISFIENQEDASSQYSEHTKASSYQYIDYYRCVRRAHTGHHGKSVVSVSGLGNR